MISRFCSLQWFAPLAVLFCGLTGTLLPAAYGLVTGIPEPRIHDEFSYLLSADTFAHGRLTNPTPTLPEFFEAPHILVTPTYSSKYPPGQGLALAFGQLVGGHPIWGVWLSCGLFAASLCWMLQAWTSRSWALAVTLVAIATLGVSTYWAQSYWGGMLGAAGGALLFGGMRRTWREPRLIASLLMGFGVVLLALTRPFEGLLVCLPVAAVLGWWFLRSQRVPLRTKLVFWILPFGSVVLLGGASMAAHNRAVTGTWWRLPYHVHQAQYFHQGPFLFSAIREPERRPAMRLASLYDRLQKTPAYGAELVRSALKNLYLRLPRTTLGLVKLGSSRTAGGTYFRVAFWTLAVSFLLISLKDRWLQFCLLSIFMVVLAQAFVWWWYPHYGAPLVPLVLAAAAISSRHIVMAFRHSMWPRKAAPAIVALIAVIVAAPALVAKPSADKRGRESTPFVTRSDAVAHLEGLGGAHLVFIRYDDDFPFSREWVWNSADMQAARVIFAHDLGVKNQQLMAAHSDRTVWFINVSRKHGELMAYPRN